jgi:hypothetical protein
MPLNCLNIDDSLYLFYQHIYVCVLSPFRIFDQPLGEILPCPNGSIRQEDDIHLVDIAEPRPA